MFSDITSGLNKWDKSDFNELSEIMESMKKINDDRTFMLVINEKEVLELKNNLLNGSDFEHYKNSIVVIGATQEICDKNYQHFISLFPKDESKKEMSVLDLLKRDANSISIYKIPVIESLKQFMTVIESSIRSKGFHDLSLKTFMPTYFKTL